MLGAEDTVVNKTDTTLRSWSKKLMDEGDEKDKIVCAVVGEAPGMAPWKQGREGPREEE